MKPTRLYSIYKYILFLVILASPFCHVHAQSLKNDERLNGLWKGQVEADSGYMQFNNAGYVWFYINQDSLGGPSYNMDGVNASMKFQTGVADSVLTIDLVIYNNSNGEVIQKTAGIYAFTPEGWLLIAFAFDKAVRPDNFDGENSMLMRRIR